MKYLVIQVEQGKFDQPNYVQVEKVEAKNSIDAIIEAFGRWQEEMLPGGKTPSGSMILDESSLKKARMTATRLSGEPKALYFKGVISKIDPHHPLSFLVIQI
jgi:hypothetical protein